MNNPIHAYNSLGHRLHKTPIGKLPGVTTILSETKDKSFLKRWRDKVGDAEANRISAEAIDRGNVLHKAVEDTLNNKEVSFATKYPSNELIVEDMFSMLVPVLNDLEPLLIEQNTYHPLGFAGTPDLVARVKSTGKIVVFDWKNSLKAKHADFVVDYYLQVAAYALSVEYTHGIKAEASQICIAYLSRGKARLQNLYSDHNDLKLIQAAFIKRLKKYQDLFLDTW